MLLKKKLNILVLSLFLFTACSSNVVTNLEIPGSLPETPLVSDSFKVAFSKDISFWKDVYNKYGWLDIIFYTPNVTEVIEVLTVSLEEKNTIMNVKLSSPTTEKTLVVTQQSPENLYFNILNIPEVQKEMDLHYDYLNERYKKSHGEEKDIGMTRGRKEWYTEKFTECEEYLRFAREQFKSNDLPEDISILVLLESGCEPSSKSEKNALGIFQMLPETARKYGLIVSDHVDERLDSKLETFAAIRYFIDLSKEFQDYLWAINAYHSGEGNLRKAQQWTNKYYPDMSSSEQFIKIIQEFSEDKEFNNEDIYFYGSNSARYTILFTAMMEAYKEWVSQNPTSNTPLWWDNIAERKVLSIKYPEEMEKTSYTVQSGDTLSGIAKKYLITTELLRLEIDRINDTIHVGEKLVFSHPKFFSLGEYLKKKGKLKILENKEDFCKKNPSILDCMNISIEDIVYPNKSSIFY